MHMLTLALILTGNRLTVILIGIPTVISSVETGRSFGLVGFAASNFQRLRAHRNCREVSE